jgi:hypothetical protein
MKKQGKFIMLAASLVILLSAVAVFSFFPQLTNADFEFMDNGATNNTNSDNLNKTSNKSGQGTVTPERTSSLSNNILGTKEYGKVVKEGPYGNKNSAIKVAYIVGVHPLESNAHRAAIESIKSNDNSLKKCYYIYTVVVTQNANDYNKGRMNGQLLANAFIVPDIKSHGFQLAVDVHSNRGNYLEDRFVFAPVQGGKSESIARNVVNRIPGLVYHVPFSQTSPQYVTIPLINAGTPAIIFETLINEPYSTTKNYVDRLVRAVDDI